MSELRPQFEVANGENVAAECIPAGKFTCAGLRGYLPLLVAGVKEFFLIRAPSDKGKPFYGPEISVRTSFAFALLCAWLLGCPGSMIAADLERAPIHYSTASPKNAVAALIEQIRSRKIALKGDENHGYLASLLKHLEIPTSSQVLVFSRTSLQRSRIGPKTPRAIYFNDEVTVGFCLHGDMVEIAVADPVVGTAFYTVDQNLERPGTFKRQTETCLLCHASSGNQSMPGHLIRSVFPDHYGEPIFSRGTKRVDHTTPFADRWGGWYVTGTSGKQIHLGNVRFGKSSEPISTAGVNVTDLKSYFSADNYLTPHSDLTALMVLEHQTEGHNRLARANLMTRLALADQANLNKALGRPEDQWTEATVRRIYSACEPLVEYLLFCKEASLSERVTGTSAFASEFAARGPFDSKSRSLREFDLKTRIFRYPLSYLIYSHAFDGLPIDAKDRVYLRLWEVLTGKDQSHPFAHLSSEDRRAILEIVRETKQGLPAYWK